MAKYVQQSVENIEQKIADAVDRKIIDGIRELRNESAKGKTRFVIELKRDAPASVVLNNLYKHTPLQTSFAANMVALIDGIPRTINLRLKFLGLGIQILNVLLGLVFWLVCVHLTNCSNPGCLNPGGGSRSDKNEGVFDGCIHAP